MISPNDRAASIAWEDLTPKERGTVLYRAGLLSDLPKETGLAMMTPAMDRFYSAHDRLSVAEKERFNEMATYVWNEEKELKVRSMEFLRSDEEGYSDRIIVALGLQKHPVKSRAVTALLGETGAVPKNGRNLLNQLMKAGAVQEEPPEEGGETHFSLTTKGINRRDQLLG